MASASNELIPITPDGGALTTVDLAAAAEYAESALAPNTLRAYRSALANFGAWCRAHGLEPMPASPEAIAAYVASLADQRRSPSTIGQRLSALRWVHEAAGHESPTGSKAVRATVQGIRRKLGVAPRRQKAPATVERIAAMLAHADASTLKGKRDRALLLLGFAMAARRSELVALTVDDLEHTERGLLVTVRRSKTDQTGQGMVKAVPFGRSAETCPVQAVDSEPRGRLPRSRSRRAASGRRSRRGRALPASRRSSAVRAWIDPRPDPKFRAL